ncbi:MAG: serine/threonine protein kinase, partial [Gemmataceae bacterium]|nr:serine/threonine protein kinase [Gemmataceae bacterium]
MNAIRPGCLAEADLLALLDGSVPARSRSGSHLDSCPDCQEQADRLSRVPDLDRRLAAWSHDERLRFAPSSTPVPPALPARETGAHPSLPAGLETVGPAALPGPRRLGKYRLLRLIGEGGMGEVWLAEDTGLRRDVALKLVRAELASGAGIRERFLREARLLAGASHDHVVAVFDQGEAEGELFLVMELLEGEPLDRLLARSGPLPVAEAVWIAREAALGLAHLHEKGLVHRDLKPANLFLQAGTGRVKLLDLGLARHVASEAAFTRSGVAVGTPAYMSPEQAEGKPVDARTDLFSLGCVLHHMLGGAPPFKGDSAARVMSSVLRDAPPRLARRDVPAALARLVHRLL